MYPFLIGLCTLILQISGSAHARSENFDFLINHPYAGSFWKNYAKNAEAFYGRALDEDGRVRPPINQGLIANPWQNNGWLLVNGWNGIGAATTKNPKKPTKKPTKPTSAATTPEPTTELTADPSTTESTTDSDSTSAAADASTGSTTDASTTSTTDVSSSTTAKT